MPTVAVAPCVQAEFMQLIHLDQVDCTRAHNKQQTQYENDVLCAIPPRNCCEKLHIACVETPITFQEFIRGINN